MQNNTETIFLSKHIIEQCKKFTNSRVAENQALYERRGGFKQEDILSGAMAESAVYKLLKSHGVAVKKPDFKIYAKGQKSYDADLSDGMHHFHVKGQTLDSKKKYGASWIMQKTDPILNNPETMHYLVPCTVDTSTGRVEVYGIMSLLSLVNNGCIGECKVDWFRKTKVAIYLDHIEGILTKKARWGFLKVFTSRYNREHV